MLVTNEEADSFIADAATWSALLAERRGALSDAPREGAAVRVRGRGAAAVDFKDRGSALVDIAPAGTRLQGLGISPGRYTGPARVITSLDVDSGLEPGEVIVAEITDASWDLSSSPPGQWWWTPAR